MENSHKDEAALLSKLRIDALNEMQLRAKSVISSTTNTVILSPTGSGKTLAFLLPLLEFIDPDIEQVQAVVIVPTRELAIQIEQVARNLGAGIKVNAVYGGRSGAKDRMEMKSAPALLIGTPGRLADHFRRESISINHVKALVLDEFDKSLEIGFEKEMIEIASLLSNLQKRVLTSATELETLPEFLNIQNPEYINFLDVAKPALKIQNIFSPSKDKLEALKSLLLHLGNHPGVIFCNFKESIDRVSEYLDEAGLSHGIFHGGLEQKERERALIKFRNGTYQLLLATDLAARGIDIPEIRFIVHYHLPNREEEFVHRNGRTARMNNDGTAFVLYSKDDRLPDYINIDPSISLNSEDLSPTEDIPKTSWRTIFVSGGRKDKISKGDIAGLFMKQGGLKKDELGIIELKSDCAFVAVDSKKAHALVTAVSETKLKKKKVRVTILGLLK